MPRRIEDEFDVSGGDAFEIQQSPLRAAANAFAHRTTGGGQGHGDTHLRTRDFHVIDQAEVHDVHADFGIKHLTQRVEDGGFGQWIWVHGEAGLAAGNGFI